MHLTRSAAFCLVPFLSLALVTAPAHATTPVNGTYDCNTGQPTQGSPSVTISSGEVVDGDLCVGRVVLPEGVLSIGPLAFDQGLLTAIQIPKSISIIKASAFSRTNSLIEISFDPLSELVTIEADFLDRAPAIASLTIPAGVTTIGDWAFDRTNSLQLIRFLGNAPSSIGANTFSRIGSLWTGTGPTPVVQISRNATGFGSSATWNGLTLEVPSSTLTLNNEGQGTTQTLEFGETPTIPIINRDGFNLTGWSSAQGAAARFSANLSDFSMGPDDQTLFAVWEEVISQAEPETEQVVTSFAGPLLRSVDKRSFTAGESSTITFTGKRLHQIERVTLDGLRLDIVSIRRDQVTLQLPSLLAGVYTIVVESSSGKLTLMRLVTFR